MKKHINLQKKHIFVPNFIKKIMDDILTALAFLRLSTKRIYFRNNNRLLRISIQLRSFVVQILHYFKSDGIFQFKDCQIGWFVVFRYYSITH